MRSRTRNWIYTGLVLALLAGSQTGCKSGWKMPSADMFSWGRKPSESTLVGSGPSVSSPGSAAAGMSTRPNGPSPTSMASSPGSPLSPASRSTPNAVNSTAVNPSSGVRPSGTNFGGYGPNAGPAYGANASAAPVPGAAASANGYSTGAYATNQSRAPMGLPGTPYGQGGMNLQASGVQPSAQPMSASPQMSVPQLPAPQIPLAQGTAPIPTATPNYNYPGAAPTAPVYGGMAVPRGPAAMASGPGNALPPAAVPSGFPMNPQGATATLPPARPAASQGLPALPVSTGSNLPPGLPPSTQMPMAYGGTASSSMPMMSSPASSGTSNYRPGSVGRNNPYDFSNQGPGAVPSAATPSFPRTAVDPNGNPTR
jgi:hypothetical protein